jgi:CBS domain-containing protein
VTTDARARLDCEVVVPLKWDRPDPEVEADLEAHLRDLAGLCDVTVVDGSTGPDAERRRSRWSEHVRVLRPEPRWDGANGKVGGAMTGIAAARHERVVVADDDVRYSPAELAAVVAALRGADVVLPQNHPTSWPWWAWWESGRVLLNRACAVDWPGTAAVRRSTVLAAGGWSPDVLFENLEMVRSIEAAGGVTAHRPDLLVARRPPPLRHFLRQRVRQAYEDRAQPGRWLTGLAVVPGVLLLSRRRGALPAAGVLVVGVAEAGRRRQGGRRVFPASTPLAAPLWLLERGVCSWVALGAAVRGGPWYHGRRIPVAAHSLRDLRDRRRRDRLAVPDATAPSRPTRGMAARRWGRGQFHPRTSTGGDMSQTVRDIMTAGAECVGENDTVVTAAERMASLDVGALPICGEDDRLKGMVTDRDIVIKVVAQGQDPRETTVGTLAEGGEVVTIGADDDLEEARRTMQEHQVRRLPVIDGHRLVGILSQGDLAQALPDASTGAMVESISEG